MSDLIDRRAAIDAILHITNCKSVRELFEYNQAHHLTEMWSGGVNDAIDAVIGVESATDKNVGTKISREPLELARAIDGLTEWQKHVQTDSNINRDISIAIEALKAQLGTNLAEVGTDTISRQAAIDVLDAYQVKIENGEENPYAWARLRMSELPSAQPEIIRCNSCKYWTQTTGKMKGYGLGRCDFHDADLVACNGFCYWAERRTDG